MQTDNSKNRVYLILIGLLLLLNSFLLYNYFKTKAQKTELSQALATVETEKADLQKQYDETVQILETYKIKNIELDSSLLSLQSTIENQKNEIAKILSRSGSSKKELEEARGLIAQLKNSSSNYIQQLEELRKENTALNEQLTVKEEERKTLISKQEELVQEKTTLTQEKEQLNQEKTKVTQEKEQLSQRFNRAAVLDAENVKAVAVKYRNSGKEVETKNTKKAERIKVCFDLLPNKAADAGQKAVYLRILSPEGTVVAVQSLGSGTFKLAESGQEQQYTAKGLLDYNQSRENYCLFWEQDMQYDEGTYSAEIYHEGFKIGSTTFELKDGLF
ncbi:MAG: hypothetical protein IPL35_14540 [Sphingobacteriales bacterium]|nr:hypothetical protein [Sphingobacteriales bacterium]